MTLSDSLPKTFVFWALGITVLAIVVALVTDPSGVSSSILASLIMLGPSAVISGYVISRYVSRRTRKDDVVLLASCFMQLARMITLTDTAISVMKGAGLPLEKRNLRNLALEADRDDPLALFLAEFEKLEKQFNSISQAPGVDPSDRKPWVAAPEFFEFPDFPLVDEFLSRVNPSHRGSWSKNLSALLARWYETAIFIFQVKDFWGRTVTKRSTGVVEARAEAYLQNKSNRRSVTVSSGEYLMIIQEALRNCIHFVGQLNAELKLPKKCVYIALVVALSDPEAPLDLSRVGSAASL
ncbi:hypothetical protein [Corynebacterium glutamicum]|uniref:hypothetical protein n=1 Tax=Corynebacterium glutamicum TaxID=1718 RepID=UPI00096907D2|nr:hypothetical protein [Corynebacterium glutamicum]OKX81674.1 hypothetical protein AUO95_07780 [Corynebacterium glutamicum]